MADIEIQSKKLPTIQELYKDADLAVYKDQLQVLLNQPPPEKWIKQHPYIKSYRYLPIDKIEFLLKKIFKHYKIEVLREGTSFNGVYVVVRVHYLNPVTGDWDFHDGIGAKELQVKSGSSPADLGNINPGALSMAFPIAKTIALKDACDHFGTLFGSDINRKDVMQITEDDKLKDVAKEKEQQRMEKLIEKANDIQTLERLRNDVNDYLQSKFDAKWKELSK